ncbi:MAG: T9SS type A sorting domain-containing protein [Sphingobacteriaceae bacterium]|nr:T9SS type A sorting domain-containing protein [Sphingobacteriaceae bacterium]
MAVFINGTKIDLLSACQITLGCQTPVGSYSISNGCLIDAVSGDDGGISGTIILIASAFSQTSISTLGVATSEPGGSGTIFEIIDCSPINCSDVFIKEEIGNLFHFKIIPNPSNDFATLVFTGAASGLTLTITNISGELLKKEQVKSTDIYRLNRADFSVGLYFISIIDSNGQTYRTKFVFK